ncbi:T9SS type B sorting domain-containing protein [Flavobacterium sp. NRK1]|uniref:T9SS type B sorting domain-containing protein n=1 Tax=Flavobacterium sp. NRK1 TaxID=2954929 RepID=UPI0020930830|nr:T9SS type B sorting domain-containing protein [Flavobacterium sp. NRK1]MCO6146660.1 T9SS type B sorting domain-containing protein [Flavobacterium sp. NRK1]
MKQFYMLLIYILFSSTVYSQLADFNLILTKTDETCLGNGSLTFTVTNQTPNSTILYKVYVLPDVTNPITILTDNSLGSLSAATYKVEAIQSLDDQVNKKEKTVTILNKVVPFNIDISTSIQHCTSGGDIIVTATSGIAASYEIIYGPVTRPLQSSNVFEDLPSGTYNIRAFDTCGVGKVKTYTLTVYASVLAISDTTYPETVSIICDSITVMNTITATSGTIAYPLSVQSTLSPLSISGDPIVINQTFSTGDPGMLEVAMTVPRYFSQSYTYDIKVVDKCTQIFEKRNNIVDPNIDLSLTPVKAPCAEKFIRLNASKYVAPYKVNFISSPDGFIASDYNSTPYGPFTQSSVDYGDEEHTVPFGDYVVEITDLCGRKAIDTLKVEFIKPEPSKYALNNGCFSEFGYIRIALPDSKVVSASIIEAPSTYTVSLPSNIALNITLDGKIALNNMPLGEYLIEFTDDCGFSYEVRIVVPPYVEKLFEILALPSCTAQYGTVRVNSGNGPLTAVSIIAAPMAFNQSLPYDVSSKIAANGMCYIDELPPGTYTFRATDICGVVKDQEVIVEGYNGPGDAFSFIPNCGSFSVNVDDNSNGMDGARYWLQYYSEEMHCWINPIYSQPYVEGNAPDTYTGIELNNHQLRNNFEYKGKMRVVKVFESFGDGTSEKTICVNVLGEFTYTDSLAISAAYTLACAGKPTDVILEIIGYPVVYRIKQKNGEPFIVDNGTSNIFTNLEAAEYLFEIEDNCGNIDVKGFNVQELPSIADATQPGDMIFCAEPGEAGNFEFHLTDQNPSILGPLNSGSYTITYHASQEDADNNVNPLPEYYQADTNGKTIYARLVHNEIGLCYGTTSFKLFVGEKPVPTITTIGTICNEGKVAITAEGGYQNYVWSDGQTGRTIYVDTPGIYTVTVEKAYGADRVCEGENSVEIKLSVTPEIVKIDTNDWTRDNNSITVHVEGSGDYEYSIDGMNYQTENIFTGLETGVYQVYVKDAYGCGEDIKEVVLLTYPNFFTPNGDGQHDYWRIEYAVKEPHMKVDIFDRYGKHLTSFGSNSAGWDGTFNGTNLPSTDYWFVVTREDGRQLRGHFSMLR